jgi:hypothetical protein
VVGIPRLKVTLLAAGSSFSETFGGSGIYSRIVASFNIRLAPLPLPSSLPSWTKSGSLGFARNRSIASRGETVPVSLLWHIKHVRPFPAECLTLEQSLAILTFADTVSLASLSLTPDRLPPKRK